MTQSEISNEIVVDSTNDVEDDLYIEDDYELDITSYVGENDPKNENRSAGSIIRKSGGSHSDSENKNNQLTQQTRSLYSFDVGTVKRDPVIEAIIQSREFTVIENPYTRLAQSILRSARSPQDDDSFDLYGETEEKEHRKRYGRLNTLSGNSIQSSGVSALENEEFDDGLSVENDGEINSPIEKSSVKVYEDNCKRSNICPCSIVSRSLNSTKMDLSNYGLGPKGCSALAVALVRNTTILSLNLSGNNIGSCGMSYIYQILTENAYIEEFDFSFNELGTKGISKLADGAICCAQMTTLNVAGNQLTASDINILLSKLEEHRNIKNLNISHNRLDEEGGTIVAQWLADNNSLINFDISWCSIRLTGAKALAKSIGDNNKLVSIDLSHNSFTNETVEIITNSLTRSMMLRELNLRGNQLISRYDGTIKENPSSLITGKENQIYKMLVAAATNQSLKIFRLGRNHIDIRCLIPMLESLSKLENLSLEELDLTGITISPEQISRITSLFENQSKLKCFVGPVRQTIEYFVHNLLDLIQIYCQKSQVSLIDMFDLNEGLGVIKTTMNFEQFLGGLRRAKIPFQPVIINDIMKYLAKDHEQGLISLRSLHHS